MEAVLGALYRTDADSITGWCWCPARPLAQCDVEVLIDGVIERRVRSARRFEGVRRNGPPHDHYGFLLALPAREGKRWHRIDVREQRSGVVFARLMEGGEDPAAGPLKQRIDEVRRQAEDIVTEMTLVRPGGEIAPMLAALGAGLRGIGLPPISLPDVTRPKVSLSLIVTGCDTAVRAYAAILKLVGPAADLGAEILLLGDLSRGGLAALAAVVRGLRLIDGAALEAAFEVARGEYLLALDGRGLPAVLDLTRWIGDGIWISANEGPDRTGLILGLARADWQKMAPGENLEPEAAAMDMALQAGMLGLPVTALC